MESKYDFKGAHIGTATFIEQQFGTLQINSGASLPVEKTQEIRERVERIRSELSDLKDKDPAFATACAEVEQALSQLDAAPAKPKAITDRLKTAADALGNADKAGQSTKSMIELLGSAARWIATIV